MVRSVSSSEVGFGEYLELSVMELSVMMEARGRQLVDDVAGGDTLWC